MSEVTADTAVAVESAPTTEAPATTIAPEVKTEAKVEVTPEQALDQELSAIYRKANPDREPDGKYAATDKPAEIKPVEIPPMPTSWAKANEQIWQELTPAAREIVLKREADSNKGVEQLKQQYEPYKGLEEAIKPHKALLASMGMNEVQGVQRLIAFHQAMQSNPQRAILEIAQQYQLDLPRMFAPQGQQQQRQPSPAEISTFVQRQIQDALTTQKLQGEIDAFSRDKSREHYETLKPEMAKLLVSGVAGSLEDAYDKALRLNPELSAQAEAKAKASEEEKVRAEAAKKVAAINVKGNAANAASPKPLDDQLREIYRRNRAS